MTSPPPIRLNDSFLDDGVQLREGLVEVQFLGEWGVICINDDDNLMSTVCRQLGYSGGATKGARVNVTSIVWMQTKSYPTTSCPDDAARIDQCSRHAGFGSCNESFQIQCEGKSLQILNISRENSFNICILLSASSDVHFEKK